MGEREPAPQQTPETSSEEQAQRGDQQFTQQEKQRFPTLIVAGVLLGAVVIIIAWAVLGYEYAVPLVILAVVGVLLAVGFRLTAGRNRDPAASEEGGLPAQAPDPSRPLGDTSEAHDEINPHDFPLYNPGRRAAERMAGGAANTTRGMQAGGAAGRGGKREGETMPVGENESGGASTKSPTGPGPNAA